MKQTFEKKADAFAAWTVLFLFALFMGLIAAMHIAAWNECRRTHPAWYCFWSGK